MTRPLHKSGKIVYIDKEPKAMNTIMNTIRKAP